MKIGFIGLGNMATAMIGGMLQKGIAKPEDIIGSSKTETTAEKVKTKFNINTTTDNTAVAEQADILFLAVKPIFFPEVIAEIKDAVKADTLIVSIAAGRNLQYLKDAFGKLEVQQDAALKCKFLIFRMSSALIRIAYTVTEDSALFQRFAMLEGPIRESRDRFTALCLEVWELVNAGKKKSSQILCEKAMQIIDKEYGDPSLSLVGVSNSIHVSPNYLSALIKKETGSSFVDLLTKKRIETARELVLGSSMKMREIAERCGYSDQHYFSYCFKKYCGVSPNAMRQEKE